MVIKTKLSSLNNMQIKNLFNKLRPYILIQTVCIHVKHFQSIAVTYDINYAWVIIELTVTGHSPWTIRQTGEWVGYNDAKFPILWYWTFVVLHSFDEI